MAAYTKGKASPSLSPASEVRVNRTSSFSSISRSRIHTGLFTARARRPGRRRPAPDRWARGPHPAAAPRPAPRRPPTRAAQSRRCMSGMAMASSRHVRDHRRQLDSSRSLSGRSMASPTPISATSTTSSVTCSMTARLACGSSGRPSGRGREPEGHAEPDQHDRSRDRPPVQEIRQHDGQQQARAGDQVDQVCGHGSLPVTLHQPAADMTNGPAIRAGPFAE